MGCGLGMAGEEARVWIKAELAGFLIQRAFADHLTDGAPHRPWRWADMFPIATISVDRLGLTRTVLTGASGESLAFALGHVDGTARPNAAGHSVIAGHRDSRAAFLSELEIGDIVRVQTHGADRRWVVTGIAVVDETDVEVLAPSIAPRLTLVTCYPFGALRSSSQRFIVTCVPAPDPERTKEPRG